MPMKRKKVFMSTTVVALWLVMALTPLLTGWSYYAAPHIERAYHPLHDLYKPTGLVGHGLGIAGSLLIIAGVSTYSVRKRLRRFQRAGKLQRWLQFHIFLCTLGAAWITLHTTFRFSGLVAISFWSMVLVVTSGVFGRYIYVRIPKTAEGSFWNPEELVTQRIELEQRLEQVSGLRFRDLREAGFQIESARRPSVGRAMALAFQYDFRMFTWRRRWRQLVDRNALDPETEASAGEIVRQLVTNARQQSLIRPFQKLFAYWHVFHIPLTVVMFLILAVHVAIALLFGYFWIF